MNTPLGKEVIYILMNFMFFTIVNSQTKEGDKCSIGNIQGVCMKYNRCNDYTLNYSFYQSNIKYCGNVGNIICCRRNTVGSNPSQSNINTRLEKRVCERKCDIYTANYTLIKYKPSLIPGREDTVIKRSNCEKELKKLIVGGVEADPGEFPHMAVLGWRTSGQNWQYKWACGGSLISEYFVLTAAHCTMKGVLPSVVRLGEHNLKEKVADKIKTQEIIVRNFIKHPRYKKSVHHYDIALIRLNKKVRFTENIRPACLWTNNEIPPSKLIATGWGSVHKDSSANTNILRKVSIDKIDDRECNERFSLKLPEGLIDSQFCAGKSGKDTCQGDSGGPLQVIIDKNPCIINIVGITSTGSICDGAGLYTKVNKFIDWIEENVWRNG